MLALVMVQCNDGSSGILPKTGSAGTGGTGGPESRERPGAPAPASLGTAGTGDTAGTAGTTGTAGSSPEGSAGATGTAGDGRPPARPATPARRHRRNDGRGRHDGHRRHDGRGRPGRRRDGRTGGTTGTAGTTGTGGAAGMRTGPFKIIVLSLDARVHARFDPDLFDDVAGPRQGECPRTRQDHRPGGGHHLDGRPNRRTTPPKPTTSPKSPPTISRTTNCSIPTTPPARSSPMRRAGLKRSRSSWTTGTTAARGRDSIPRRTSRNNNSWTWFQDNIDGGWFVDHDPPLTPGTVNWQTDQVNHPILKGLPSPWSTSDEWYVMNRNIEAVPGFKILAKVTVTQFVERNDAAAGGLGDGERERQGRPGASTRSRGIARASTRKRSSGS